ncbi:MAG: response regulator [Myxococcaceae bacterium]|nr:response regulator [Myxococcaceae bacterium]
MSLLSTWERLERWIIHPAHQGDRRPHLVLRAWVGGIGLLSIFAAAAAREGLWALVTAQLLTIGVGLCVIGLMHVVRRVEPLLRVSMGTVLLAFSVLGLLQTPPNAVSLMFILLVPLMSSFVLSWRETKWWLLASSLFGGAAAYCVAAGLYLQTTPRGNPQVVAALNFVAVLAIVTFFARWFYLVRDEMMAQLQAALDTRTRFLANVSHEIRTPMNAVLGLTELLLTTRLDASQRRQLELLRTNGAGLVAIIDDLLDLTKLDSGRMSIKPEPTDLRALIESVVQLFAPRAAEKRLELRLLSEGLPARVDVDPLRLRQVLANLLSNAIKFTDEGRVVVRALWRAGQLELEVEDTGPGVPAAARLRIFEPFEQADGSTTRRSGGSGLGLAISRELARLMGGELWLAEQAPDTRGSRFCVRVPLQPTDTTPHPTTVAPVQGPACAQPALVVDDNPVNLLIARGLVERLGYTVETARNGLEAVEATRRTRFGFVLMDCHMPELDGLEATRQIRAQAPASQLPIIALTASGLPEELAACRAAGMDDCLVKPLRTDQLLGVLQRVLSHSNAPDRPGT